MKIFHFSVYVFKFINFKIITNSFIYSLVEQFLEAHFHKNNYRGKGYTFGKNLTKFSGLYTPLPGVWGYIIRATYEYKDLKVEWDKAIDIGQQRSCPGCGLGGLKDDECNHIV